MTREEAIKILQGAIKKPNTKDGYLGQAIDMAIQALSQEPCTDAISRDAVIEATHHCGDLQEVRGVVQQLPSVTQKSKTGHWIRITNGAMKEKYICSECGRQIENDGIEGLLPIKYPYCHCGAKMESEEV